MNLKKFHCLVLNSTNTQLFINCSVLKTMGILLNLYGQLSTALSSPGSHLSSAFLVLLFLEGDINGRINSGVFCFTLHSAPFFKMMLTACVALLALCSCWAVFCYLDVSRFIYATTLLKSVFFLQALLKTLLSLGSLTLGIAFISHGAPLDSSPFVSPLHSSADLACLTIDKGPGM